VQPLVGPSIRRGNKDLLLLSPWKHDHQNVLFLFHELDFGNSYSIILFFYAKLCLLSDSQTQRFAGCHGRGPWQLYCLGMVDWRRGCLAQPDWVCFTAMGFPLGTGSGILWVIVSAVDSNLHWGERDCKLWVSTFPGTDHCSLTSTIVDWPSNNSNHTFNRKSHDNQD